MKQRRKVTDHRGEWGSTSGRDRGSGRYRRPTPANWRLRSVPVSPSPGAPHPLCLPSPLLLTTPGLVRLCASARVLQVRNVSNLPLTVSSVLWKPTVVVCCAALWRRRRAARLGRILLGDWFGSQGGVEWSLASPSWEVRFTVSLLLVSELNWTTFSFNWWVKWVLGTSWLAWLRVWFRALACFGVFGWRQCWSVASSWHCLAEVL